MQGYFAIGALVILITSVVVRSLLLKKQGIKAFHFGKTDKKDFLIPPFAIFYIYLIAANVFNLPKIGNLLTESEAAAWVGVGLCILAPAIFIWGMISFGKSFRVGVDLDKPNNLVTSGAFSVSRNPLYIAFFFVLIGVFLIFPTWIFFVYLMAGMWLIDRQVCIEENALRQLYGKEYDDYCNKVRRYL